MSPPIVHNPRQDLGHCPLFLITTLSITLSRAPPPPHLLGSAVRPLPPPAPPPRTTTPVRHRRAAHRRRTEPGALVLGLPGARPAGAVGAGRIARIARPDPRRLRGPRGRRWAAPARTSTRTEAGSGVARGPAWRPGLTCQERCDRHAQTLALFQAMVAVQAVDGWPACSPWAGRGHLRQHSRWTRQAKRGGRGPPDSGSDWLSSAPPLWIGP